MRIPMGKVLAGAAALRHSSRQAVHVGRPARIPQKWLRKSGCRFCEQNTRKLNSSQGGAKLPTGGKGEKAQARERLLLVLCLSTIFSESRFSLFRIMLAGRRVSRFGVIPKPTVKVRMKENGRDSRIPRGASFRVP
jgi:hypothetical protein